MGVFEAEIWPAINQKTENRRVSYIWVGSWGPPLPPCGWCGLAEGGLRVLVEGSRYASLHFPNGICHPTMPPPVGCGVFGEGWAPPLWDVGWGSLVVTEGVCYGVSLS